MFTVQQGNQQLALGCNTEIGKRKPIFTQVKVATGFCSFSPLSLYLWLIVRFIFIKLTMMIVQISFLIVINIWKYTVRCLWTFKYTCEQRHDWLIRKTIASENLVSVSRSILYSWWNAFRCYVVHWLCLCCIIWLNEWIDIITLSIRETW